MRLMLTAEHKWKLVELKQSDDYQDQDKAPLIKREREQKLSQSEPFEDDLW